MMKQSQVVLRAVNAFARGRKRPSPMVRNHKHYPTPSLLVAVPRRIFSVKASTSASAASNTSKDTKTRNLSSVIAPLSQSATTKSKRSLLPLELVLHNTTKRVLPYLGHASYLALASGFVMTDMLELRLLLVGGYSGLVAFHSLHERPLKIPLGWSAVFVAVNAVAVSLLLADRFAPSLNTTEFPDGETLYQDHFQQYLTRGQFLQLLSLAKRHEIPAQTILTREHQPCSQLYFLVQGQAHVYHGTNVKNTAYGDESDSNNDEALLESLRHNPNIATIEQGGFVNDVAFQQQQQQSIGRRTDGAYGTIVTSQNCQVLVWDTDALKAHLQSKPDMNANMKYCLSDHLVKSLLRQREAAQRRQLQRYNTVRVNR